MAQQPLKGILATIGSTPLVELESLVPDRRFRVFAKLEQFNPGGSIKDRTAVSMLLDRITSGELRPGRSVVVESSSGNLAIGIAQICRFFGLRFVCVVDAKTTEQNLAILHALQAEVDVVDAPDPETGEYLSMRIRRVRELVERIPHAFWPNQYANPSNPRAHLITMREIVETLDRRVDYLFCSVSSFGTLRGCAEYVRQHGLATKIVGVDAVGSAIFHGQRPSTRLLPGHGTSIRPALFRPGLTDRVVHVADLECVAACRRLTIQEAVLAGGSSGATVAALDKVSADIPDGANCVLIFPDGGDRYLDTIYSDSWVYEQFGDVSYLWKESTGRGPAQC